jgi:hypothetical protein
MFGEESVSSNARFALFFARCGCTEDEAVISIVIHVRFLID